MDRRNTPLEIWEWRALCAYAQQHGQGTGQRFAAQLDTERLVHRARFLLRSVLLPGLRTDPLRLPRPPAASTVEHRLFLLFAE